MSLQIVKDQEKFDHHQLEFVRQLIASIKDSFTEADVSVPEEDVFSLVSVMSFHISALLDASAIAGSPDDPTLPYLAFKDGQQS